MSSLHSVSLKSLLGYWVAFFATSYVANTLLYVLYKTTPNPVTYVALFAVTPIAYLLFALLYFRGAMKNDWTVRFVVAGVWIGFSMVGTALLMQPMYGYPWTAAFGSAAFKGQLINLSAILVAGWAMKKS